MEWLPQVVADKGPWAILAGVLVTVLTAVWTGKIVPAPYVDRLVKSYETVIAEKKDDVTAWKAAHALEVEANRVLREQVDKLLEHSTMSAQAWQAIKAAAESRTDDPT